MSQKEPRGQRLLSSIILQYGRKRVWAWIDQDVPGKLRSYIFNVPLASLLQSVSLEDEGPRLRTFNLNIKNDLKMYQLLLKNGGLPFRFLY